MIISNNKNISYTGPVAQTPSKDMKKEPVDTVSVSSSDDIKKDDSLKKMKEKLESEGKAAVSKGFIQRGTDAFMSGAVQTSEYLDKHSLLKSSADTALEFFKTLKSFPGFIYPSLINMSAEEKALVLSTLDALPLKDVNSVKSITMFDSLPGAAGIAYPLPSSPFIKLSRQQMNISEKWAKFVITHEVGHTRDFETAFFGALGYESGKGPWGQGPYISDYASTEKWEDFAESFGTYYREPEKLKAQCPEKYERLQEFEKTNFFEKLIDNESFRETGKFIGEKLEKAPYLQNGLAMISYIAGFFQAYKGLGEMRRGEETGDAKSKMDGNLDLAAGLCFSSKIFCIAGMAIDGTKTELDRAINKKEITPEQANAVIEHSIGIVAGPIGKAVNWVLSKLPGNEFHKIDEQSMAALSENFSEDKFIILKSLAEKDLTGKEMNKVLGKLGFDKEEIGLIKECSKKYSDVKEPKTYEVNDMTIESLNNIIPDNKLDAINGFKDKEFYGKDFDKALKKSGLNADEINMVKIFAASDDESKANKPEDKEIGSLKKALGIAIGAAAGSTAGGFIGPYLGVMAGFALAGPLGGVIGLIAGAIAGVSAGSRLGGKAGKAIGGALENTEK